MMILSLSWADLITGLTGALFVTYLRRKESKKGHYAWFRKSTPRTLELGRLGKQKCPCTKSLAVLSTTRQPHGNQNTAWKR